MELTWLPDTPQSRRRTRALRACANCQRRKKRCRHLGIESKLSDAQVLDAPKKVYAPSNQLPGSMTAGRDPSLRTPRSLPPDISQIERFVGDLNPEAVIREKITTENGAQFRDKVGLWINSSPPQDLEKSREGSSEADTLGVNSLPHRSPETASVTSILQLRYSAAIRACERLPPLTMESLIAIYFSRVNHIIPLVDQKSFTLAHAEEAASVFLERAICLVAAKDQTAGPHLRLVPDGPLLSPRRFCTELYRGLVTAMNVGFEPDRVTRIRILALMSLHSEGHEGAEAASMHLCQAIHQAQTAGLQHERPGRMPEDSLTSLFWCLWTLDKMHACIGGRPVLLADGDIGIERPDQRTLHSKSAFDVWFSISDLLSTVISFYRPSADHTIGWEENFPTFEEIVGDHIRKDLDFTTLGVLELYYHAVSILSHRCKLTYRPDSSKPSYIRQGLAAIRIYSLVATECFQSLPPLPIVPYGVALSMGVSYQQFRSSKLITHSDRAKASLEACCTLLEGLGVCWSSAEAMARLGRKTLGQIQGATKFPDHEQNFGSRQPKTSNNSGNGMSNALSFPTNRESSLVTMTPSIHPSYSDVSQGAVVAEQPTPLTVDEVQDVNQGDGFTDIDNLFGEFLDLSLPTNFWDPVFFPSENTDP